MRVCVCVHNFSKSFEVNETENAKDRSDGIKSNDGSDAEIEPDTIVGSIPTSDLSESDDAEIENENEENDSSLGMSWSPFNCSFSSPLFSSSLDRTCCIELEFIFILSSNANLVHSSFQKKIYPLIITNKKIQATITS